MRGKIVTITSGKGGVGKTTTTSNLATALALAGKKVVAVDADIGLRNLDLVMGLESRIMHDLVDVVEGHCLLHEALVLDHRTNNLSLLPAAQTRDKAEVSIRQMMQLCETLRQEFDYVLIDSPAGIEHGFQTAVAPADLVLIVTTSDVSALRDADKVIYLLERDRHRSPGLILNRYNLDLVRSGEMRDIDDVLDILSIDLLGVVPEDSRILLSTDRGMPAVYNRSLYTRKAYRNIAQRLMGNNVPLMNFRPGPLAKLWARLFDR